ncbi:MAG: type VI immunity family protein [Lachnospiraceae bacterium]
MEPLLRKIILTPRSGRSAYNSTVHAVSDEYNNSSRGVNWITVLDNRYIKRLGGEGWVRQVLSRDPAIGIELYPGGLLIRAGQYPDLTPLTAGLSPHYLAQWKRSCDLTTFRFITGVVRRNRRKFRRKTLPQWVTIVLPIRHGSPCMGFRAHFLQKSHHLWISH